MEMLLSFKLAGQVYHSNGAGCLMRLKSTRIRLTPSYDDDYRTLGLKSGSDQEAVRRSFVELCKKYHPDSGTPLSDSSKFQQIENAYRSLQKKFSEDRWNVNEGAGEYGLYYQEKQNQDNDEVIEYDINHTAPQHRQYLSWNGVGYGTVSQRQQQYSQLRAEQAADRVREHKLEKLEQKGNSLTVQDQRRIQKAKIRYGMERLVEDLIQESMARGDFENLTGSGKPLREPIYNPYVDFITHKMNEVLIDNGFTPEWISLAKEIKENIQSIRNELLKQRSRLSNEKLSLEMRNKLEPSVIALNKKIELFNLVVPILNQQMLLFRLEDECKLILDSHITDSSVVPEKTQNIDSVNNGENDTLLNIFTSFFVKK